MGKCPPGVSYTSAKSTLLGISCSNTFFIDLYQRLRLQRVWVSKVQDNLTQKSLSVCQPCRLPPSAKQNKQVMVCLHHLSSIVCIIINLEHVLQAVTGRGSIWLSWENSGFQITDMQQQQQHRVKQGWIQIATGAMLTLTFSYELRVE